MTNVTMKATDTLHISALGPDNLAPGEEFEVSGHVADDLESRGLAKRVGGKKSEAAPDNKAAPAPDNKADKPALSALNVPAKTKGKK
jgi:hypothetical protein